MALRRNDCIVNILLFLAAERIKLIAELKKNKIFKPTLPGGCYSRSGSKIMCNLALLFFLNSEALSCMEAWRKGKDNPQTVSQAHSGSRETCEVKGASSGRSASVTLFLCSSAGLFLSWYGYTGIQVCLELERRRGANSLDS